MKLSRFPVLVLVCGVFLASATPPAGASASRAVLRGFLCQRAREPSQREISVQAVMRPVSGTVSMALRFKLYSKTGGQAWKLVSGRGLDDWVRPSDATLGQQPGDVWIVNHPVVDLAGPATYVFKVAFRWTGAGGRVLETVVQSSPRCFQPELRPDLAVKSIKVKPIAGDAKHDLYVAVIRNVGGSAAGPFEVLFAPGGVAPVKTRQVRLLAAHTSLYESFLGPVCTAGSAPAVTVDPLRQVPDDLDPSNNSLTATCS